MFEFLDTPRYAQWNIKVHYSQFTGEWNIEGKSYDRSNVKAYSTYGTSRINAYKIIEENLFRSLFFNFIPAIQVLLHIILLTNALAYAKI